VKQAVHPVTLEVVRNALYAIAESSEGGCAPLPNLPQSRIAPAKPALARRSGMRSCAR